MGFRFSIAFVCSVLLAVEAAAKPGFVLPPRLYAALGHECSVYFQNVFSTVTPRNYAYEAVAAAGRAQVERWCWTPSAKDAGRSVQLVLKAWSDDGLVAAATTTVEVAAAPRDSGRVTRVALFADSLTNSRYQDELYKVLRGDGFTGYTPVGSRRPKDGGVPHDGYGGYDCGAFLSYYNMTEDEVSRVQDAAEREQLLSLGVPVKVIAEWQRELLKSPLISVVQGRKRVDVPGWIGRAGGVAPDVVIIQLGVNALFGVGETQEEISRHVRDKVIPGFEAFVRTLRPHLPRAVFGITTVPLGCGQDGFGANYGATAGEVGHRIRVFELNRALFDFVRERNDPLLELVPVMQAIDPHHGFLHAAEKANARTDETVDREQNALHPSASGGCQLADAIAAWYECRWNAWISGGSGSKGEGLNIRRVQ